MLQILNITIWFILSLIIFLITYCIWNNKETLGNFKKLYFELKQLYLDLLCLKESYNQYLYLSKEIKNNNNIITIWFPDYKFNLIYNNIPIILFKNSSELFISLENINNIISSISINLINSEINKIKNNYLNGKYTREEAIEAYLLERKFIEAVYKELDSYLKLVLSVISNIILIMENNSIYSINFKLEFSEEKIKSKLKYIKETTFKSFNLINETEN